MKFVHIADVHLGLTQTIESEEKIERKTAIWETLNQVFSYVKQQKADFLFIPGDLFHRQPLLMELKDFNYLCEKVPETNVVFIAGNHDYLRPDSNYLKFEFAKNVFFFKKNTLESIYFPNLKTRVYGFSYWSREITEPLYDELKPLQEDGIHILLSHGGDAKHIPISEKALKGSRFDYIALGHIHQGGQIVKNKAVMAGSLLPTDINDIGSHGFWSGEITKESSALSFHPIKRFEYRRKEIEVTAQMSPLMIKELVMEQLAQRESYQLSKIFLKGKKNPLIDFIEVYNEINKLPGVISVEDNLVLDYDLPVLQEAYKDQLLGKYIQAFLELPQNTYTRYALLEGVDAIFQSMEHK